MVRKDEECRKGLGFLLTQFCFSPNLTRVAMISSLPFSESKGLKLPPYLDFVIMIRPLPLYNFSVVY